MDIESNRNEAKKKGTAHGVTWWKDNCRMRPRDKSVFEREYKNDYGTWCKVYTFEQCVPMREVKPQTDAQKKATKKMLLSNELIKNSSILESKRIRAIDKAKSLINSDIIVIDTETTDLHGSVIELSAIASKSGEVLIDTLVFTDNEISTEAYQVHQIDKSMIANAPSFLDVLSELEVKASGRKIVSFNSDFDFRVMSNSCLSDDDKQRVNNLFSDDCLMYLAAQYYGATNRHGTISLENAMYESDGCWTGDAHRALADTKAALHVLTSIANSELKSELEAEIEKIKKEIANL